MDVDDDMTPVMDAIEAVVKARCAEVQQALDNREKELAAVRSQVWKLEADARRRDALLSAQLEELERLRAQQPR